MSAGLSGEWPDAARSTPVWAVLHRATLKATGASATEVAMSAPSTERTTHWQQPPTSHWTRDGRYHLGPLENCRDCPNRPDEREPRPSQIH